MPGLFDGTPWERPVTCPVCGKPRDACTCPRNETGDVTLPQHQQPRVRRERRAGNKTVTIITGLDPHATDLAAMLRSFKSSLGTGGTLNDGQIELQGDHRDKLVATLQKMGYRAKPAGG